MVARSGSNKAKAGNNVVIFDDDPDFDCVDLDQLLEEFSENSNGLKVFVHELDDGKTTGACLFTLSPDDFSMDGVMQRLRSEFGNGSYKVSVRQGGKIIKGGTEIVKIKLSPAENIAFKKRLSEVESSGFSAPAVVSNSGGNDVKDLINALNEKTEKAAQRQHEMMLAMINGKQSGGDLAQLIEGVKSLKGLSEPEKTIEAPKDNSLDSFLKFIEVYKTISGESEPASIAETIVKEVSPLVKAFIARQQASERVVSTVPVSTPQIASSASVPDGKAEFDFLVGLVSRAAQSEGEPVVYGQLLIDQLGDDVAREYCLSEDSYKIALTLFPEDIVKTHGEWFAALRLSVLELLGLGESDSDGLENAGTNTDTTKAV